MTRAARSLTLQPALPEWAAIALLLSTLVLEAYDLWHDHRAPQSPPITREDCFAFCAWTGTTPQSWGSYSCQCFQPPPEAP